MPALPPYEEVAHTADWALRVRGASLSELFAHAAQGMYALLAPESAAPAHTPADEREIVTRRVTLTAPDVESLLVAWLNELVFFTESEGLVFADFRLLALSEQSVEAVATGRSGVHLQKQIKAVTFHNLKVSQTADGFEATVVFDV